MCMCEMCACELHAIHFGWYSATSVSVSDSVSGMDLFHSKRLIISRVLNKDNTRKRCA